MKKFGTRLISAVLAGCMMTSVLPVSAHLLWREVQNLKATVSAQEIPTLSAQENSDAPGAPPERWQRPVP